MSNNQWSNKLPSDMVREFHLAFELPINETPEIPGWNESCLRQNLLLEEVTEYVRAVADDDLVEIADALADIIYIVHGTALVYGIPLDEIFDEVHASNMAKLVDNKPIYREDGKVLKPQGWQPPNIGAILDGKIRKDSREDQP